MVESAIASTPGCESNSKDTTWPIAAILRLTTTTPRVFRTSRHQWTIFTSTRLNRARFASISLQIFDRTLAVGRTLIKRGRGGYSEGSNFAYKFGKFQNGVFLQRQRPSSAEKLSQRSGGKFFRWSALLGPMLWRIRLMDDALGHPPNVAVFVFDSALSVSVGHISNLHFKGGTMLKRAAH